eukprot:1752120-Amphidinium_carterae.1
MSNIATIPHQQGDRDNIYFSLASARYIDLKQPCQSPAARTLLGLANVHTQYALAPTGAYIRGVATLSWQEGHTMTQHASWQ